MILYEFSKTVLKNSTFNKMDQTDSKDLFFFSQLQEIDWGRKFPFFFGR